MLRCQIGWVGTVALVAMVCTLACAPQDVESLRQNYTARVNQWIKTETPVTAEGMITVQGGGDETAGEAAGETDDETATGPGETVHVTHNVTLDILVEHKGGGTLPGITLDIYQADADEHDKRNWKHWVDTSDMGVGKQITLTLEGLDLEEGDTFAVNVRAHVPPEERSEYREFNQQPSS